MKNLIVACLFLVSLFAKVSGQTQQDTIFNYITSTPVVVDGVDDEACWDAAEWHDIGVVWLPYLNAPMDEGDFEGKFKVAWDADYLYLLVEVVDDMISDDHEDPLEHWWDDDCLEIFIDEDRSKGWHQNSENAFAYHVSITYDAIDLNSSGNGINYKDHLDVVMKDLGNDTYLWELAIKIYSDDYNHSSPEDSRVTLTHNKIMGFTLAYCDNDEGSTRENFIGSMNMPSDKTNVNYQTADYFGSMKLVDPNYVSKVDKAVENTWQVYPNPVGDELYISASDMEIPDHITIRTVTGQVVKTEQLEIASKSLNICDLREGIYLLSIEAEGSTYFRKIIKQ